MSKKKETENLKESIFKKSIDLGFLKDNDFIKKVEYQMPFGAKNKLSIDFNYGTHLTLDVECDSQIVEIRQIEYPEDLENLFNAICPEKYRLPFD